MKLGAHPSYLIFAWRLKIAKETLINCLCGMKRKAHGTQKPRHINRIVEVASTAQRSDSPAQAINQGFPKRPIILVNARRK